MRLSTLVRIGIVLSALWAVGSIATLALTLQKEKVEEVSICLGSTAAGAQADENEGFASEAHAIYSHRDNICAKAGQRSLHRTDWVIGGVFVLGPVLLLWAVSSVSIVVARWIRRGSDTAAAQFGSSSTDSQPGPQNVKRWKKATLIVASVLVLATYTLRHTGTSDTDEFFSCNEQSINAFYAEQARKGIVYDEAARTGIEAVAVDKCMSARGYEFMGGANGECMSARTNECYSRKWATF